MMLKDDHAAQVALGRLTVAAAVSVNTVVWGEKKVFSLNAGVQ